MRRRGALAWPGISAGILASSNESEMCGGPDLNRTANLFAMLLKVRQQIFKNKNQ